MAGATWAYRPLCGPPWVLKYPYCQPHPRGGRRVLEKVEFSKNFQVPLNGLNRQFGGFQGGLTSHYVSPHGCLSTHIVTK